MFENVVSQGMLKVIDTISPFLKDFYLAGGTGLAIQLGHRISIDLDFFSPIQFETETLLYKISPNKVIAVRNGTIHCEREGIKLSFLFYKEPLVYPIIIWKGLNMADWRDITAEKFKAISQRGSKKDFYDLYSILKVKLTIEDACEIFKKRFATSGVNRYHVLKSLIYFDDAEADPEPTLCMKGKDWEWRAVKLYFEKNVKIFEKHLIA